MPLGPSGNTGMCCTVTLWSETAGDGAEDAVRGQLARWAECASVAPALRSRFFGHTNMCPVTELCPSPCFKFIDWLISSLVAVVI